MFEKLRSILGKPSVSVQVLYPYALNISYGDIGRLVDYDNYRGFLQKQTDQFELVFLVLGNHEFYSDTFVAGLQKARQLEQEPCLNGRLVLLHQGRYAIPGSNVTILGCTLWSRVPDETKDVVKMKIQDFKHIQDWTIESHNENHEADLNWLLSEMESIQNNNNAQKGKRSVLVVTHHAPSLQGTSSPQHANNPWSSAFGTDILPQISRSSGIKAWVFGHTHYTTQFSYRGISVVANQRGYVFPGNNSKGSKDGFDVRKVISV